MFVLLKLTLVPLHSQRSRTGEHLQDIYYSLLTFSTPPIIRSVSYFNSKTTFIHIQSRNSIKTFCSSAYTTE